MNDEVVENIKEDESPSIPTELLDLHIQLEENNITPFEFKEVFGNDVSDKI